MNKSKFGTILTDSELDYRKKLVSESGHVFCPVSHDMLSVYDGEIIYVNGGDYFISTTGIEKLKDIFGDEFIKERIITYD